MDDQLDHVVFILRFHWYLYVLVSVHELCPIERIEALRNIGSCNSNCCNVFHIMYNHLLRFV